MAQFGFRCNYEKSVVEYSDNVPEILLPLRQLLLESCAERLKRIQTSNNLNREHWDPTQFTRCIINVYEKAQDIIPWHWDHVDFGPTVLVFTFGEDRPLHLRTLPSSSLQNQTNSYPRSQCHHTEGQYSESDYQYYTAYPRHGSCYIRTGPVRYQWEHFVPKGSGYRVSITFRTHRKEHFEIEGQ